MTVEEYRDELLRSLHQAAVYWATVKLDDEQGKSDALQRAEGLVFSVLAVLDGCGNCEAMNIYPESGQYDDGPINAGIMLHNEWSALLRKWGKP